jgi:hypothetical protein
LLRLETDSRSKLFFLPCAIAGLPVEVTACPRLRVSQGLRALRTPARKISSARSPRASALFRIFSDLHRMLLWSFANCGCSRSRPIWTTQSRLCSRNGFLSISPAFASITRHCGFLLGLGRSAGDPDAPVMTAAQVVRLLQRPIPSDEHIGAALARLEAVAEPINWPSPETSYDEDLLTSATVLFLQPARANRAKRALRTALGGEKFELLIAFLTLPGDHGGIEQRRSSLDDCSRRRPARHPH